MVRERRDGGHRVYVPVTGDATEALRRANYRATTHNVISPILNDQKTLRGQISEFLSRYGQREAGKKAREALNDFQLACPDVRTAKGITQDHVLRFQDWLKAKGNKPRTVANKHKLLHVFLRKMKVDLDEVMPKDTKPPFEDPPITAYKPEEIQRLLEHASPYMALVVSMAHGLGLRERELMHAEFTDVLPSRVHVVQAKPRFKFTTKTHENRNVTIHAALYERIMEWQRRYPERRLILGVGKGHDTPCTSLLSRLKALAAKAGVKDATLHKFRRTFITTLLRSHRMSLREVQAQAGHKSLAATNRYLEALGAETLTGQFDSIFG